MNYFPEFKKKLNFAGLKDKLLTLYFANIIV